MKMKNRGRASSATHDVQALAFLLLTLIVSIAVTALPGIAAGATVDADWRPPPMPETANYGPINIAPEKAKELAEKWGVELLGIRLTAENYMMDFRFHVIDADKALPLFDHRIKPYVIADRSDIKLPVPMAAKVGAFRPTNRGKNITSGRNYYMVFGNPDRHVKQGETVTVVIGEFTVEGLTVN
jgi:hypothetical protein